MLIAQQKRVKRGSFAEQRASHYDRANSLETGDHLDCHALHLFQTWVETLNLVCPVLRNKKPFDSNAIIRVGRGNQSFYQLLQSNESFHWPRVPIVNLTPDTAAFWIWARAKTVEGFVLFTYIHIYDEECLSNVDVSWLASKSSFFQNYNVFRIEEKHTGTHQRLIVTAFNCKCWYWMCNKCGKSSE